MIRSDGPADKPHCLYSHETGKKLGCFATMAEAEQALARAASHRNDADDVVRYDGGRLAKAERTSHGGYKIPIVLMHAGAFPYKNPDGSTRMEFRSEEEVFSPETIASANGAPFIVRHPRLARDGSGGLVTPQNYRELTSGTIVNARREGMDLVGDGVVIEEDALSRIDGGEVHDVSCGILCKYDPTPGTGPDGTAFDGQIRRIRINHVAGYPKGLARVGGSSLRLDARGSEIAPYSHEAEENRPMKIRLDSKDLEIADPELAKAIVADQTRASAALDAAKGEVEGMKQRIDALTKERDEAKKALEEGTATSRLDSLVGERVALHEAARAYLGKDYKPEGKTPRQIHEDVVRRDSKDFDLKDTSDDFVRGAARVLMASASGTAEETQKRLDAIAKRAAHGTKGEEPLDEVAERRKMNEELEQLHKRPAAK